MSTLLASSLATNMTLKRYAIARTSRFVTTSDISRICTLWSQISLTMTQSLLSWRAFATMRPIGVSYFGRGQPRSPSFWPLPRITPMLTMRRSWSGWTWEERNKPHTLHDETITATTVGELTTTTVTVTIIETVEKAGTRIVTTVMTLGDRGLMKMTTKSTRSKDLLVAVTIRTIITKPWRAHVSFTLDPTTPWRTAMSCRTFVRNRLFRMTLQKL